MAEPSIHEIKLSAKLPKEARFLGWVIHLPVSDEYLATFTLSEDYCSMGWVGTPEKAKYFKTLKKSNSTIKGLEIADRALAAPAFDVARHVIVVTPEEAEVYKNPLRELTDKLKPFSV
jgi:hypothetical protein